MLRAMKKLGLLCSPLFALLFASIVHGFDYEYDYSATPECLEEPWSVQYRGGVLADPGFDKGTEEWTSYGKGKIKFGETKDGNKFGVAFDRENPTDSLSQRVELDEGMLYAFSAWLQVSEGNATVSLTFIAPNGDVIYGGGVMAEHGCWSMLKGGIVSNFSGTADMVLKSNNTAVDIWADNVSLQPFTETQWRSHQEKTIQKVRKSIVNFRTTYTNKTRANGAIITLRQTKPHFPLGCSINEKILTNTAYQNWFKSRFTVTAFTNEMKWYATERVRGKEDYTKADAMMRFAEQNHIAVRGHNVLWDDPKYQPNWVYSLSPEQLKIAVQKRINSVVNRYKGRLIHWDVVNENVHFHYFEDRLGKGICGSTYGNVHRIDPRPTMFMNEYNTIEESQDWGGAPEKYLSKLREIMAYPGNRGLPAGIGLQSRFRSGQPNLVYMRAGLDKLAATRLPIWLTEVLVDQGPYQWRYLEQVLREGYGHPAVRGIVMWPSNPSGPNGDGSMYLTYRDFHHNTHNGVVVDKLIKEWGTKMAEMTVECDGFCSVSLPNGEYEVRVRKPETNLARVMSVEVKEGNVENLVHVEL